MTNNIKCIRVFADEAQINNCRDQLASVELAINETAMLLALAGNEVRLKILFFIKQEKELCPCDLADILNMSIPAISQHLRKLKDGNIIIGRRSGQTIFYSLNSEQIKLLKPLFKHIVKQSLIEQA